MCLYIAAGWWVGDYYYLGVFLADCFTVNRNIAVLLYFYTIVSHSEAAKVCNRAE